MLQHCPKLPSPLLSLHSLLSQSSPTTSNSPTDHKPLCDALLSATRSRWTPQGLKLHARIVKLGFRNIPLVSHSLINFYSKTRLPCAASKVFDETAARSATTWSSVIACFAQNDLPLAALEHFRRMLGDGLGADDRILPSAAKAAGILGRAEVGRSVHGIAVKTAFERDVFVGSAVVDMYAKCGEIEEARKVFDGMPEKNVVSWSGMISGYVAFGKDMEAVAIFKQALVEGVEVNDFTFTSVARVCGNLTLLELGKQIHGLCFKTGFDSSSFVGTSLVSLYARCGVIEGACRVFHEIGDKNLGLWNAMLLSYAQHAETGKALVLFEEMKSVGTKPNFITFLGLLYACSHSGLVEKGHYYFDLMKEYGIKPGAQHYATLVDMLGRAGNLHEAISTVEKMPISPTESVWGALLTGCRIHSNTELAASVADRITDWHSMGPGIHVLLANAYAASGRWDDAARVRKRLRDHGVRKETGLSWIEAGKEVHSFVSRDRTHARSDAIYEKLEELYKEIEKAGYVVDTRHALKRVDGSETGEEVRYHSERLAVAFGMIALAEERVIRVMKNLRVCYDCHNAIKLISKCFSRVVVLRDNNRFHRFQDGKCNCGDYW